MTPTALVLDKDGNVVDWVMRFTPPADAWKAKLQKSLDGVDTFKSLSALCAKDPKNVEAAFKLGLKYESRYEMRDKAADLFRQIVALDPGDKAAALAVEGYKEKIRPTEYAEFTLGQRVCYGAKPDPAPLRAFIAKHPKSPLLRDAYEDLSYYYGNNGPKEEACKFLDEYIAKYPDYPYAYHTYIQRIIDDKGPYDQGLKLAEKLQELTQYGPVPEFMEQRAELYLLNGDKDMAGSIYGSDFVKGEVRRVAATLANYARFWLLQNENLDSAENAALAAIKIDPASGYARSTAASIVRRTGNLKKALAIYGPSYADGIPNDWSGLYSYASFWRREGKNLPDALAAAQRAVELEPRYYTFDLLGEIQEKLKNYPAALAAAEKALALAGEAAKFQPGFPLKRYEDRVKQITDAAAKAKSGKDVK